MEERTPIRIAALFVARNGAYFGVPGIDPWDESRDARLYAGPYPVIAHPPCERWGRYWFGGPSAKVRREKGDDDGCFASAMASVERYGGVLEHPEASSAWRAYGMMAPSRQGGWIRTRDGYTCCVEQGHYGHRARKATWLYYVGESPPQELRWGKAPGDFVRLGDGYHSAAERARAIKTGACQRLSKRQRAATPVVFRDLLISLISLAFDG